ncbi:hypothetical protein HYZ41_04920 [archaeon]|nr:hypothetical protein [archaeon]
MTYDYRHGFGLTENKKHLVIYVLAVILILSLFVFGKVITGYATYTGEVVKVLNETKSDLSVCETGLTNANNDIAKYLSDIAVMKPLFDTCKTNLNSTQTLLETCGKEKTSLKAENAETELKYDALASHAAMDICCLRGVTVASWSIVDNFILCSGNKTVSCTK